MSNSENEKISSIDDAHLCSLTKLSQIYGTTRETVLKRISHIPPRGERNGFPVWHLRDVSSLVDPEARRIEDPELLSLTDQKRFLEIRQLKQEAALRSGELCEAAEVRKTFVDTFKQLSRFCDTLADVLRHVCGLSDSQAKAMQKEIDKQRTKLHAKLKR